MSFLGGRRETAEEREMEQEGERRSLRRMSLAPASTLVGTAVLTQLILLSGVAIAMGVAVVSMCAFIVELLVLAIVATALERGLFTLQDLGTLSEIAATLLFTFTTLILAAFGDGNRSDGASSPVVDASSVAALKFT